MNVLSCMIENKLDESNFKFHWRCAKLKLTYLYISYDLLLFANSDVLSRENYLRES